MSFGNQTVEIATVAEGTKDAWGIPDPVPTWVPVTGCRFRPLSVAETVALTDATVEIWKLTAPPDAAVLEAKPNGQLRYGGVIYEIEGGPRPFTKQNGPLHKVTIICKRQQKQIA